MMGRGIEATVTSSGRAVVLGGVSNMFFKGLEGIIMVRRGFRRMWVIASETPNLGEGPKTWAGY